MGIHQLNHAVLYVGELARSVGFYAEVLGFTVIAELPGAAFLRAADSTNDHDLGLFQARNPAATPVAGIGLYHLAWEVGTLGDLEQIRGRLSEAGALVGASDHGATKSLYGRDPDGLEFEIVWLVPRDLLTGDEQLGVAPLDLAAEITRYGRDTRGGIGISLPA
ncbi:VOC family protein [Microlunatus speluncae]|uniref:VOC family protein n=1 Tax=Microlunatus speluncae TaxID=2594267 RepID=UPI0012665702|nr:VOC family protein [Microlunatus speluncae]